MNKKGIKISVVVPVYNVEDFILKTLESIRMQTYRDIEAIFIDDCGKDGSMDLVRSFVDNNPQLQTKICSHTHNRGLSAARNTGIDAASGDYVYFLDSDDFMSVDCLSLLVDRLSEYEYDIVIGGYDYGWPENKWTDTLNAVAGNDIKGNSEIMTAYRNGGLYVMAWNKLCNLQFLKKYGLYFEERLIHEDILWSLKVFSFAESIALVKNRTYHYIERENSIMSEMNMGKELEIHADVFDKCREFIKSTYHNCSGLQYGWLEGKKAGLLYMLLERRENELFKNYYNRFRESLPISPANLFLRGQIGIFELLRDAHYLMPNNTGRWYKRLFYVILYKCRGKKIKANL